MTVRHELDPAIVIFDADNTLWDTNSVFRMAQLAMLRPFADRVLGLSPEDEFTTLRQMDRLLFQHLGKFEYDFRLLAEALALYYLKGYSVYEAAHQVTKDQELCLTPQEVTVVNQAHQDYIAALQEIPPLLPETQSILNVLRTARRHPVGLALTLLSEGNPDRLGRILEHHGLAGETIFDATHIGPKNSERFERIREIGLGVLGASNGNGLKTLVVGDSLKREIKYGNQIGATTIYIPAGFMGAEQPGGAEEQPDYTLSRLGELPVLMRDLHLL